MDDSNEWSLDKVWCINEDFFVKDVNVRMLIWSPGNVYCVLALGDVLT